MRAINAHIPQFLIDKGITQIVSLDFETFYSVSYTLRKMSTSLYIFDEQFHSHGVGIRKTGENSASYFQTERIPSVLKTIDWSITALLCHHTQFDALILSHHYNITPAYYLCSMSMARPMFKNTVGVGLDKLAKHLGFQGKTSDILARTKGIRNLNFRDEFEMGEYCKQDITEMDQVYNYLESHTTEQEFELINLTVKMYAEPIFEVDIPRIEKEIKAQIHKRDVAVLRTGLLPGYAEAIKTLSDPSLRAFCRLQDIKNIGGSPVEEISKILRSAPKFALALENLGVQPPKKISPTTGNMTYAFAKTDLDYIALGEHPNAKVRYLYKGRLAAKSTTALDKATKLLAMSAFGPIPVYLNYWAAQTGRWSGGDKIQLQNMPRGGEMRKSIIAPDGHELTVIDSSGIEMRILAWLSKNESMLRDIRTGLDTYKKMAANIYNITYESINKLQRFIGKIAILGLGYGMSGTKFQLVLKQGIMGPPVKISLQEAERVVQIFRTVNYPVPQLWTRAHTWLQAMMEGTSYDPITYMGITFSEGKVVMPTGAILYYPGLRGDPTHIPGHYNNLNYQSGNFKKYIYGALFVENIVQSLARLIIAEQMLAINKKIPVLLMVHDEVVCATPIPMREYCEDFMYKCFTTNPTWCPDLPLDAEYGTEKEYSK